MRGLPLLLILTACQRTPDKPTFSQPDPSDTLVEADTDVDVDTDSDTDTDTDADADSDADTDPTTSTTQTWPGTAGAFQSTYQGRNYLIYVPPQYQPGQAWPLVVGFHGAGDDAYNYFGVSMYYGFQQAADDLGFIYLVPDTLSPYSDWAIWSGNPNDDFDEMITELDSVLDLTASVSDTWRIDDHQIHAFGFSDGGLFLGVAGFEFADELGSLAIVSYGWGGGYLVNPPRKIPVEMLGGSQDGLFAGAPDTISFLAGQGHDTRLETVPGVGHLLSGVLAGVPAEDITGWMLSRPLP